MDELSFGVAAGSFLALLGVGALMLAFLLRDRSNGPEDEPWHADLRSALGAGSRTESERTVTAAVDGTFVDFTTDNSRDFEVTTPIPERDLSARMRAGEFVASGDGWTRLQQGGRAAIETYVRDAGWIEAGRIHFRAKGVNGAVHAAERMVALSKILAQEARPQIAGILRRVTSADDPGRVSIADIPENVATLTEPGVARVSLAAPPPFEHVQRIWAAAGAGEDRALAIPVGDALVVVVADGAGGMGGGAAAAERIIARTQQIAAALASGVYTPAELLAELDRALEPTGAQAAATIAVMTATRVFGACAGDVEALLVTPDRAIDLTAERRRKPLLGSGEVAPVSFAHEGAGTLLVATDGLFGYAARDAIADRIRSSALDSVPDRLVELVRLRSGDLQDDVGLIIAAPTAVSG